MNRLLPLVGLQLIAAVLVILNAIVPQGPLPPSLYFNPPNVYAALNTIFLVPAGVSIAYISSKGFRNSGLLNIQLLGCGALALCISTAFTWIGVSEESIAVYYAMLELFGIFFGSVFQLSGALLTYRVVSVPQGRRLLWVAVTYSAIVVLALVTLFGSIAGWIPSFFVPGETQTFFSRATLVVSAVVFSASAVLLGRVYLETRSEILYWYMVGTLLVVVSIVTYVFIRHPGDPISWLYRSTTFLYGGAFVSAVLRSRPSQERSEPRQTGAA